MQAIVGAWEACSQDSLNNVHAGSHAGVNNREGELRVRHAW